MISLDKLFKGLKVDPKDKKMYKKVLKGNSDNKEEKIISHFMKKYVYPLNMVYSKVVKNVLSELLDTETPNSKFTKSTIGFKVTSKKYKEIISDNYKLVANLVIDSFMKRSGIKEKQIIKRLKNEVFEEFNGFINGAMTQTETAIINDIRKIQREVIQNGIKLKRLKDAPNIKQLIVEEKKNFKTKILKKYPDISQKIIDGKILKSKPWIDKYGNTRTMNYTLDTYTDIAIEGSILNMDTTTSIIEAENKGNRVVEFYIANNRALKTGPFPYCKKILSKKIKGKSLLALDEDAASILGIDTVDTARANGSLDRRRRCRHSIRNIVDKNYNNLIEKILYIGNLSIDKKEE